MRIVIEPKSLDWLIRELNLTSGKAVRFFARYGGETTLHPGFSLGMAIEDPVHVGAGTMVEGILFYIRDEDLWYLDGKDLHVQYLDEEDAIAFVVGSNRDAQGASDYLDA